MSIMSTSVAVKNLVTSPLPGDEQHEYIVSPVYEEQSALDDIPDGVLSLLAELQPLREDEVILKLLPLDLKMSSVSLGQGIHLPLSSSVLRSSMAVRQQHLAVLAREPVDAAKAETPIKSSVPVSVPASALPVAVAQPPSESLLKPQVVVGKVDQVMNLPLRSSVTPSSVAVGQERLAVSATEPVDAENAEMPIKTPVPVALAQSASESLLKPDVFVGEVDDVMNVHLKSSVKQPSVAVGQDHLAFSATELVGAAKSEMPIKTSDLVSVPGSIVPLGDAQSASESVLKPEVFVRKFDQAMNVPLRSSVTQPSVAVAQEHLVLSATELVGAAKAEMPIKTPVLVSVPGSAVPLADAQSASGSVFNPEVFVGKFHQAMNVPLRSSVTQPSVAVAQEHLVVSATELVGAAKAEMPIKTPVLVSVPGSAVPLADAQSASGSVFNPEVFVGKFHQAMNVPLRSSVTQSSVAVGQEHLAVSATELVVAAKAEMPIKTSVPVSVPGLALPLADAQSASESVLKPEVFVGKSHQAMNLPLRSSVTSSSMAVMKGHLPAPPTEPVVDAKAQMPTKTSFPVSVPALALPVAEPQAVSEFVLKGDAFADFWFKQENSQPVPALPLSLLGKSMQVAPAKLPTEHSQASFKSVLKSEARVFKFEQSYLQVPFNKGEISGLVTISKVGAERPDQLLLNTSNTVVFSHLSDNLAQFPDPRWRLADRQGHEQGHQHTDDQGNGHQDEEHTIQAPYGNNQNGRFDA